MCSNDFVRIIELSLQLWNIPWISGIPHGDGGISLEDHRISDIVVHDWENAFLIEAVRHVKEILQCESRGYLLENYV